MSTTTATKTTTETVGDRIHQAMEARGVTVSELAVACDVTRFAVHHWLRDRSEPYARNLVAAAKALDVPTNWLLIGRAPSEHCPTCQCRTLMPDMDLDGALEAGYGRGLMRRDAR